MANMRRVSSDDESTERPAINVERVRQSLAAFGATKPAPKPKPKPKPRESIGKRPPFDAPYKPRPDVKPSKPVELPPGKEHGTSTAHSHYKCRCAECREWAARYKRERTAIRQGEAAKPKKAEPKPSGGSQPQLWRQCLKTVRINGVLVRCAMYQDHSGKCLYEAPPSNGYRAAP